MKAKPNQTDLKIQKPKTRFLRFSFEKNDFSGLGTVFHVVSFTIHLAASSSSFYFANVEHRQQQVRVAIVAGQQGSELH